MRVTVDRKAKIAWVIGHKHPIASFAFGDWGGETRAADAAQAYIDNDEPEDWEVESASVWNDAIEAAALICAKRASGISALVGADAEGQLEGAHDDIRALLKTPF